MKNLLKAALTSTLLIMSSSNVLHASNQCSGSVLYGGVDCNLINSEGVSNTQVRAWQSGNWQSGGGWASFYASVWNPNFLVVWDNNDNSSSHKEFDASLSRSVWTGGGTLGYGKKTLRWLYDNEWRLDKTMTAKGKWENWPQRKGKSHVQVIMWLNKNYNSDTNSNQNAVDITIAEWMTNEQRSYLHNNRRNGHYREFLDSGGYSYYKAPGGVGELATYLIVRNSNINWHNGRTTKSSVNWMNFLKNVRDHDWMQTSGYNKKFTDQWYISSMGWEVTGANKDLQAGITESSQGKFQFSCLEIPNLDPNGSTNGVGYGSC